MGGGEQSGVPGIFLLHNKSAAVEQVLGNPILGHSGAERSRWRCTTTTVKAPTELGAVLDVSPPVEGMRVEPRSSIQMFEVYGAHTRYVTGEMVQCS